MQRHFLIHKFFWVFLGLFVFSGPLCFAASAVNTDHEAHSHLDQTQLIIQQVGSLKKRLSQAKQELDYLHQQQKNGFVAVSNDQTNKDLLYKTQLHLASTKASLKSIDIELSDSQQTMSLLDKNIQEIENQLNALNIFGNRLVREGLAQVQGLRSELKHQGNLYQFEKMRTHYLLKLQNKETDILQLYNERDSRINAFLKSQKMLQLKERQGKSELTYQEQQDYWLRQLNQLYGQMRPKTSKSQYARLESKIFYANENSNLIYLKMQLRRYQEQIGQMRLSLSRTSSISALNALFDQAQSLGRHISQMDSLIDERIEILKKRSAVYLSEKQSKAANHVISIQSGASHNPALPKANSVISKLTGLERNFQDLHRDVELINEQLSNLRGSLDKAIQHELAARQGLPGFSLGAWLDLGKEAILLPVLSYKLIKGFFANVAKAFHTLTLVQWFLFFIVEALVAITFSFVRKELARFLVYPKERSNLFANIKYWLVSFLIRNQLLLAIIGNLWGLFYFLGIPQRQYAWLMALAGVWMVFRVIGIIARAGLVETTHDSKGYDVRLYRSLKAIFAIGALITSITVFLHQLPLIYQIIDFFDRLFLLLLLVVSILILRSWRVVPELVMTYIDPHRTYLRRIIYFMGIFAPSLLFVNSLLGLFGFVNLVWMIVWYEGVFTVVLIAYFLLRGLLNEGMEELSNLMIAYVNNGWLWTEAFLKPLHSILGLLLFLGAWVLLFVFYGWDQHSAMVGRLNNILFYPLAQFLNTTITVVSIFKLVLATSIFYWAARWTREFVFRLLLSKTHDLGIRNSMAILSQYAIVILGIFVCLKLLGIDLHALFLVASGLLIAISFGLRDLVNNFACGLILLFERPVRVGDVISVNDKEGRVTHIGSRAVTMRTWDHTEFIVPNTELFNKSFVNWTVKDDIVRCVISIKIDRRDDLQVVKGLVQEVLKNNKNVLINPAPEVFLKEMMDTTAEFDIHYYINMHYVASRISVRSEILYALWQVFREQGIHAPNLLHEILTKNQNPLLAMPE